jgi:outer membrane protein assembly factor BamB
MSIRARRVALIGVYCCLFVLTSANRMPAGDWPMWRCDAGHTAASPDDLPEQLHLDWTRQYSRRTPVWDDPLNQDLMPYDRVFEPVVSGRMMFVGFNDADKVVAIDVDNGEELWTFHADGPVRFSPVAALGNLYFASDDGHLYCLDAQRGNLKWKFRGGPSARKVIGNKRVISAWPARGGPVVGDNTVYFAASIWPFMGTFIYALDAQSGEPRWTNDATSAEFMKQPHNASSFASVAPQGQLAVSGNKLLVPGGRSAPAVLDCRTGDVVYFHFSGKGEGGSSVVADESRFFVHTRVRETVAHKLSDGRRVAVRVNDPVLADGFIYTANTPGEADGQPFPAVIQAFDNENQLAWQVVADGSGDLIKAGKRLYAAGPDAIVAVDPPTGSDEARVAWSIPVEGQVLRLVAAADRLFAVTLDGRIIAFGAKQNEPKTLADAAMPVESSIKTSRRASQLLDRVDMPDGYALWFGVDDGQLLEAVVAASELHVVGVDPDAEKIDRLRRRLDKAGLYGNRVALHQGDPATFQAPPYMASLIVLSESAAATLSDETALGRVYESVRPYGGKLWIPADQDEVASLLKRLQQAALPKARLTATADGVLVVRQGALPGAADWTHAYGDVANTVKSDDQLVKLPLGVLWFGGNSNMDILPRHGHGPSQQVVGGRLFIQGINSLSARDVYTGRVLWIREFEDLGTFQVYYDESYANTPLKTNYNQVHIPGANSRGTNYVATDDGVYLVLGSSCQLLDAQTGQTIRRFDLPAVDGEQPPSWGFIGIYENLLLAGVGFGDYSKRLGYVFTPSRKRGLAWGPDRSGSLALAAFDRDSGDVLWKVDANHGFLHNGIVAGGGRIYCLDKLPRRVEAQDKRRGNADQPAYRLLALDAKNGQQIWSTSENVFGTWLSYSEKHDILLQAGSAAGDRSADEVGTGMTTYRGADGSVIWEKPDFSYAGPCMLHNDTVITNTTSSRQSQGALSLLDGAPVTIANPLTGKLQPWRFTRTYGCNTAVASEHMLTFRSGAAGFYDLQTHGGTGNFGGFKSGCSSSLIAANGVLNAPDYTRTCTCAYQNQTSLALVHMPDNEVWTYNLFDGLTEKEDRIRNLGINLGAPGDRRSETGTLWVDHPDVGGSSPEISVALEGTLNWFRRHSSRVSGQGPAWIGASGAEGVRSVTLRMVPEERSESEKIIPVAHQDDDAEEEPLGAVRLTSSDLELTEDGQPQTVGIRFQSVPVPQGAKVSGAYVQFQVDETSSEAVSLQIHAQASDNAPRFKNAPFDISSREKTNRALTWQPKPWKKTGVAGPDQQTPDLAPILQGVFDRPGWKKDNAVALIITGTGRRVAYAADSGAKAAPKLFIELDDTPNERQPVNDVPTRSYSVRLHFIEPDADVQPGQRVFDVAIQGQTVLRGLDVVKRAGGANRQLVGRFNGVTVGKELNITLNPTTERAPVLCGIEVVEE